MFRSKSVTLAHLLLVAGGLLILPAQTFAQDGEHPGWGDGDERKHEEHRDHKKDDLQRRVRIVIENVAVSAVSL